MCYGYFVVKKLQLDINSVLTTPFCMNNILVGTLHNIVRGKRDSTLEEH